MLNICIAMLQQEQETSFANVFLFFTLVFAHRSDPVDFPSQAGLRSVKIVLKCVYFLTTSAHRGSQ